MAKNTNSKRAERMGKNNRNLNLAMKLLTVGFLAEFYLLLVNNYFVKGAVGQVLIMATVLKVLFYLGCALVGGGVVLLALHGKKKLFAQLSSWFLAGGVFLTLSSQLMLKVYPQGTTFLYIIVPVIMILGIVFLMYQREFSVQALALSASIGAMLLLNRSVGKTNWTAIAKGCSALAALGVLALLVLVLLASRNDGCIRTLRVFPLGTDYKLTYAVLAVCLLAILTALFVSGTAFYGTWVLSILLFILAVYYTVKML